MEKTIASKKTIIRTIGIPIICSVAASVIIPLVHYRVSGVKNAHE